MSEQMIHLAVDLLGADTPEEELCRGAVRALVGNPALFLHLCGHADVLSAVTAEIGAAEITGRYEIVDAPGALSNNEDPMQAYQRTDASLWVSPFLSFAFSMILSISSTLSLF